MIYYYKKKKNNTMNSERESKLGFVMKHIYYTNCIDIGENHVDFLRFYPVQ